MHQVFKSPFIESVELKQPNLFDAYDSSMPIMHWTCQQYEVWLTKKCFNCDEDSFNTALRQARNELLSLLAYAEINNDISLRHCCKQLSQFADACLIVTSQYHYNLLVQKYGIPTSNKDGLPVPIVIINLGKLGGEELNFSSDIDIIFAYTDDGQCIHQDKESRLQTLSVQEFYQRFNKQFLKSIHQPMADGFVFRVDTRLRPFGSSGPTVVSLDFLSNYLQNHARDWERMAYAKARVIGPKKSAVNQFSDIIEPYVYRHYTDYGLLDSIREMRDKIATEVFSKKLNQNIKLGFGGIRSLEFCLQSIQFTLVKKHPSLRGPGVFNLLDKLQDSNILPQQDLALFEQCLMFLRTLENRLQQWKDQQTHSLPDDDEQWSWLYQILGFNDIEELQAKITAIRAQVDVQFKKILPDRKIQIVFELTELNNQEITLETTEKYLQELLTQLLMDRLVIAPSNQYSLGNFSECINHFIQSNNWQKSSQLAQQRFNHLVPLILEHIALENHTEGNWKPLFSLLQSILKRSVYISLLSEYPQALERVIAWSLNEPWLTEQITTNPLLLEVSMSPHQWLDEIKRVNLRNQWLNLNRYQKNNHFEKKLNSLREYNRSTIFKIASLNQSQEISTYRVSDYLSSLARQVSQAALQFAIDELQPKWQDKLELDWISLPFLIMGYGKLGSFELGFGSDLDVVFIYDDAISDSQKHLFYVRLARKWMDVMSVNTMDGHCYDIDCRLRPEGSKSSLVTGISQFKKYYQNRARVWEKQALIKARPIVGSQSLAKQFSQIRKIILTQPIEDVSLKNEIVQMRHKMRVNLNQSTNELFDLKQGLGGMIDIEFLTQYETLSLAPEHPFILSSRSVSTLLEKLHLNQLSDLPTQELTNAYLTLRAKVHQCKLQKKPNLIPQKDLIQHRQCVIETWEKVFGDIGLA